MADKVAMTAAASPLDRVAPAVVRDGFLSSDEQRALLDWTLGQQPAFRASRLADGDVHTGIRSSLRLPTELAQPWKAWFAQRMHALLPELIATLALRPFDMERFELELACHNDGDFYRRHIDTAINATWHPGTRTISAVYYFHREPLGFSGGNLRLHAFKRGGDDRAFRDIPPLQNRLVAFPSWAPHEVMPIACPSRQFADSRFSINCWVHRTQPKDDQ